MLKNLESTNLLEQRHIHHLRYLIFLRFLLYLVSGTGRGRLLLASVTGRSALFYQDLQF